MIIKQRDYLIPNTNRYHAHVEINPVGEVDIDIVESQKHYHSNLDRVQFERKGEKVKVLGVDEHAGKTSKWQLTLASGDALDLNCAIEEANDELEILMRDLV
ncbi:hypothetical protein GT360_02270 [Vibrio astriarenae]|uniref:Uncharacterized protein n=1 Tax=Vibrio astriarenae TaxID=1481923 RepID=A0A7Z2YCW6_9VIBR|nr:hypothetical protein [Vibrio astriarenae]QIA62420.1 hypothetical protein GT360_02270 [Vibrio astriarenae]